MKRTINAIIFILFFLSSCSDNEERIDINNFFLIDQIPQNSSACYRSTQNDRKIPENIINKFFISQNDYDDSLVNQNCRYYYGFKYKIDNRYYMISLTKSYTTIGGFRNALHEPTDVILYIYDSNKNKLKSSLVILQSDPISRNYVYENGIFMINSSASYFTINDTEKQNIEHNRIESKRKYIIKDGNFIRI